VLFSGARGGVRCDARNGRLCSRSPRRAAQGCVFTHCHDPRAVAELRRLHCCRRPLGPAVGPARTRPGERGPDSAGGAARAAQAAAAARQAKGEWLVKNSRSEPHLVPPPTSAAASHTRLSTVVSRLSNVALSQGYDFMKQVPPGFVPPPGAPERKLWDSRGRNPFPQPPSARVFDTDVIRDYKKEDHRAGRCQNQRNRETDGKVCAPPQSATACDRQVTKVLTLQQRPGAPCCAPSDPLARPCSHGTSSQGASTRTCSRMMARTAPLRRAARCIPRSTQGCRLPISTFRSQSSTISELRGCSRTDRYVACDVMSVCVSARLAGDCDDQTVGSHPLSDRGLSEGMKSSSRHSPPLPSLLFSLPLTLLYIKI